MEKTENIKNLKSVGDLNNQNYIFHIPDYQRGYRWAEKQIVALLNDIAQFKNDSKNSWYCLQPLVIQKEKDNKGYVVIDGQQRLTTIYMILKYLNSKSLFTLEYTNSNEDNNKALENPNEIKENECTLNQKYIIDAYGVIEKYFKDNKYSEENKNVYLEKLKQTVKFIWYEIKDKEEPIEVFKRLNSGKIPLEDAELIKALFLNRSNFVNEISDTIYLRQLEIANEWDEMEKKLNNDRFWYFLSNKNKTDNRIEYIFKLLKDSEQEDDKKEETTFDFFYSKKDENNFIETEWENTKTCFSKLEEWFNDYELRNLIGYLQCCRAEKPMKDIYKSSKDSNKTEFKKKIKESLKNFVFKNLYDEKRKLEGISKGEHDDKIRMILLLHNVLETNNKQEFFRYDLYKKASWDIEHIASASGDAIPKSETDKKNWINTTLEYLKNPKEEEKEIKEQLENLKKAIETNDKNRNTNNNEEFKRLFELTNTIYQDVLDEGKLNLLQNLVLLDSSTNRGYKNNIFPIKRREIIKLDKDGIYQEKDKPRYLLPCTRNAFLKYYSLDAGNPNKWLETDAKKYLENLENTLENLEEKNG